MATAQLLTEVLMPADDALARLKARSAYDPDLLALLETLIEVTRELARQTWTV